ncbi:MAG TPA: type VII secretion protein EccB, partial [Micromonosporaceae bacterium]|nr:type VII secretion protein EccB [Micromonosporaceae bacterium]
KTLVPALFGALATAAPAGTAWLTALPGGLDIAPISVPDRGRRSTAAPKWTIGDVLVAGPGRYLVFDDGLAPITPLQEAVLGAQVAVHRVTVAVAEATAAQRSSRLAQSATDVQPPQSPPNLATPTASELLCAVTNDARTAPGITVGGTVPGLEAASPTGSVSPEGVRLADRVLVPAGRLAIVRVLASPTAEAGAYYLVTDLGIRYAVASSTALQMLGYQPEQAVGVPADLVTRLPSGPALDPVAAVKVAGR